MFVLDTNGISELRNAKSGKADPHLVAWAQRLLPGQLFISAITVLELETGVLLVERRDPQQGALLRAWLDGQCVAWLRRPHPAGRQCRGAALRPVAVPDPRAERDALIAATALVHGMTVTTRNTAAFAPIGVTLLDPWAFGG
ncbi:type II toxin-antitoxin system VapC family toxin [Stutzerimonas azotifigens]|uniref:type II toxin-antitoxin system VapC family toxin n=1 Tax=Stutzerimonas azotifigens TaxID=291995 RepID=UPI0004212DF3|nr:type II toxin-antitoxin system VapC family toxin [Stutzerimonas azotifigens]